MKRVAALGTLATAALLSVAHGAVASAHAQAQAQAPADYTPVGMNVEEVQYPHPVAKMPLVLYGQNVEMAYMDVKPVGTANGRTVVLLHGFNFFAESWTATIGILTREGFRVIVPDQIGFGRSSKALIPYTLNDMALNTRRLLQHLNIESAGIVGHSMGGMLASRFAMLYPTVTSHVAMVNQIGLSDTRPGRAPRYLDEAYADPARVPATRTFAAVRQSIERYFVTWKPEYEKYVRIHWGWTISPDWPHFSKVRSALQQVIGGETVVYDWQHIRSKALVIGGEVDGPNFPALARRVAESIPGAELFLIPNVGHIPQFEAPGIFHPRLVEFLRSE